MTTNSERVSAVVDEMYKDLVKVLSLDHSSKDIGTFIKSIAGEIEIYLKEIILKSTIRIDFSPSIDSLAQYSLPQSDIDNLHSIRKMYNAFKHEASFEVSSIEASKVARDAISSLKNLNLLSIGDTNLPFIAKLKRLFWLSAWDHYIGGDTEVHIVPPAHNVWLPPSLETIYIEMSSWENVLYQLSLCGNLHIGEEYLPASFYADCKAEGDFLAAGVFEGDYRSLIQTLARHEKNYREGMELLDFLQRQNNYSSMWSSTLHAAVDALKSTIDLSNLSDIKDSILRISASNYAAPISSRTVLGLVDVWLTAIDSIDVDKRILINGPRFTSTNNFNLLKERSLYINDDRKILISDDFTIWAALN